MKIGSIFKLKFIFKLKIYLLYYFMYKKYKIIKKKLKFAFFFLRFHKYFSFGVL